MAKKEKKVIINFERWKVKSRGKWKISSKGL